MASDLVAVENRLWATADQLWANTGLKPSEFSTPVLGLIFLRHADKRFMQVEARADNKSVRAQFFGDQTGQRVIGSSPAAPWGLLRAGWGFRCAPDLIANCSGRTGAGG